ncbi:cell division protein ZapA [Butyrivibrio fibrisolvens DSM 3071]|jgi:cell division protein ZapA|uniref:Cell division protein ZapA n=1 Tax=Butyrivibrio fibrisolvens DSM 3071 TaxID=1121131 RepID=A0A1M5ZFH9_BUTFI|nr:cell division protein ZapA [Butyrivibrio fibrisolvens]SHI23010.1 cell division protein ZapA [Butyrivibrio fibrisolvens DSM 3071]
MSAKTDAQVIIGGRVLTLSGYESEEYLQKVASYLNTKIADCSKIEGFNRQPVDLQSILLQLNIADDYFKAKKQIQLLEEQATEKEKELYDLKHELIASQIKLENTEKNVKNLEKNLEDDSRKIIQLETELKNKVTPISSGSSSGKGRR